MLYDLVTEYRGWNH